MRCARGAAQLTFADVRKSIVYRGERHHIIEGGAYFPENDTVMDLRHHRGCEHSMPDRLGVSLAGSLSGMGPRFRAVQCVSDHDISVTYYSEQNAVELRLIGLGELRSRLSNSRVDVPRTLAMRINPRILQYDRIS